MHFLQKKFSLLLCQILPTLANLCMTNYMCATCVDTHYTKFLEYVWHKEDATAIGNQTLLQKLSNKFKLPTTMNIELENMDSPTDEMKTLTILHSIGIENKKSNCWINSILQCLLCKSIVWINSRNAHRLCRRMKTA
jgi:ubiquitin C-terminal hydrolase